MSLLEDKSHLAMWAMMGAPLILGNDPRGMSDETLSLLKNKALLAIQADQYEPGVIIHDDREGLVMRKRLEDGSMAVLFVNLKKDKRLKRRYSFKELDFLAPKKLISVFNTPNTLHDKLGLTIELKPHDCELLNSVVTLGNREYSITCAFI